MGRVLERLEVARRALRTLEEVAHLALAMADDRNLTVHTYNEALAQAIFRRLRSYTELMGRVLRRMDEGHSL